jgi:hypothetical protein
VARPRSVGKGSLAYADGNLYILGEDNIVGLAEATPAGYRGKRPLPNCGPGLAQLGASCSERRRLAIETRALACYDVLAR